MQSIVKPSRGFTLIELLVVVSIIALLLTILTPSLSRARDSARKTECLSNLRSVMVATTMYVGDERRLPDLNNDADEGALQYNYLIYDGRDFEQCFGPLARPNGIVEATEQFFCPVQEDPFHLLATDDNPWPAKPDFDTRAGYGRRYGLSGKSLSEFRELVAYAADLLHLPKLITESGHKSGVNVVYIDGHAEWVDAFKDLIDNDLASPFDPADNGIIKDIWKTLDEKGR